MTSIDKWPIIICPWLTYLTAQICLVSEQCASYDFVICTFKSLNSSTGNGHRYCFGRQTGRWKGISVCSDPEGLVSILSSPLHILHHKTWISSPFILAPLVLLPVVLHRSVPLWLLPLVLYIVVWGRNSILLWCFNALAQPCSSRAWASQPLRPGQSSTADEGFGFQDVFSKIRFFFKQHFDSNLWRVKSCPRWWLPPISLKVAFLLTFQVLTWNWIKPHFFLQLCFSSQKFQFGNKLASP